MTTTTYTHSRILCVTRSAVLLMAAAAVCGGVARGQVGGESLEQIFESGEIEQRLEARLPLDASFVNSAGEPTSLGAYFDGEHPVILTFNYLDCPKLCNMQLSGLTEAMAQIDLSLGDDYRVVSVSIDPRDTPQKALGAEERYTTDYLFISEKSEVTRPDASVRSAGSTGWSYLVGDKLQIDRVAGAAGFGYKWIDSEQNYAHRAATILCSPDGQITRYLPGLGLASAGTLKMALVEAGEGKIGTLFENTFLFCFSYDPNTGQYTLAAVRLLKVAAALTVLAVASGIFFMRRGDAQRGPVRASAAGAAEENTES